MLPRSHPHFLMVAVGMVLSLGMPPAWGQAPPPPAAHATTEAPPTVFRAGDRVAWIGSSSTRIGVWTRTVEFLLRTRHPELGLKFHRSSTGGGTFATGRENLDRWLAEFPPTVVVFNYGGNDANAGREGLPQFLENLDACVAKVREAGARVVLVTPQAADVRKSGVMPAALRTLYAETILDAGRKRKLTAIDVHYPTYVLQTAGQRDDPKYSILKDRIHLTDPAYIAWGYFFYDRLELPVSRSDAVLTAGGKVVAAEGCTLGDVAARDDGLSFTRRDAVLPILPPGPLPPRGPVPLEARSRYLLTVTDLPAGDYAITCEGHPVGTASAEALKLGVNLNSLLLDQGNAAPWAELTRQVWDGKGLDRIGHTAWRFEVRRQ